MPFKNISLCTLPLCHMAYCTATDHGYGPYPDRKYVYSYGYGP